MAQVPATQSSHTVRILGLYIRLDARLMHASWTRAKSSRSCFVLSRVDRFVSGRSVFLHEPCGVKFIRLHLTGLVLTQQVVGACCLRRGTNPLLFCRRWYLFFFSFRTFN